MKTKILFFLLCIAIVSCTKDLIYNNGMSSDDMEVNTPTSKVLNVAEPGTLSLLILGEEKDNVISLKLSGALNSDDLRFIREMAGSDSYGNKTNGSLETLDLSEVTFVKGGNPYYYYVTDDVVEECCISDGHISRYAFGYCNKLKHVILPDGVTHIDSQAFQGCI